ncbi:hypothetical protein Tco_1238960 [Tanacetum coccineum]
MHRTKRPLDVACEDDDDEGMEVMTVVLWLRDGGSGGDGGVGGWQQLWPEMLETAPGTRRKKREEMKGG